MATIAPAKPKHMYSWWWDSHISPKNSRWLQENLTDMDAKVTQMIKLIEEDADSFARRAEMYYKKRPELMKMVEEFYRAYRALAERYDNATGVIRQAHRTMAEAFPNQVPPFQGDESPAASTTEGNPRTPDVSPFHLSHDLDESQKDAARFPSATKRNGTFAEESNTITGKRGLKELNDLLGSGGRARKGLNFQDVEESREWDGKDNGNHGPKGYVEFERFTEAELEISTLKNALSKLEAEKEASHLQYQQTLEKCSSLESEVSRMTEDSRRVGEQARKADEEAQHLKDALAKLETERGDAMVQLQQYVDKISNLENSLSHEQKDAAELHVRARKAEADAVYLKQETARLEVEKESALLQHEQLLEKVSETEAKLLHAEEDARKAMERAGKAESEAENLRQMLAKTTEQKEAAAVQYLQCLETIAALERKLAVAEEEKQKLKMEIDDNVSKFKDSEERCLLLERSNQSMHSEMESRSHEMAAQREELTVKQQEVCVLWNSLQEERLRFVEAETAFQTLQHLHSQSQDELRSLAAEFQRQKQNLGDLEAYNQRLQNEVEHITGENKGLNEVNLSSAMTIQELQAKILQLRDTIGELEAEIELRIDQRNALQEEIYCLKEELNELNKNHQAFVEQVESIGFSPVSFVEHVKDLLDENTKLKEDCERGTEEKAALMEKLVVLNVLVEKNVLLENSLSDLNVELEGVRDRVKELEESFESLQGEKSSLSHETSTLVSQLHVANDNLERATEKNSSLEKSLLETRYELEALQVNLKGLQDSCSMLENEKSNLTNEKEGLILELDISHKKIESLNASFKELEEKHFSLGKDRESMLHEVEGLKFCLGAERLEHEKLQVKSRSLEDFNLLLQYEKSDLTAAKESLVLKLETSERDVASLNARYRELQEKHFCLEKEREFMIQEAEGLKASFAAEKHEHATLAQISETQLAGMALQISEMQKKLQQKSEEFHAELEEATNAQIKIFVMEESIRDFVKKNFELLVEFQKLLEASHQSERLISALQNEKVERDMQTRSLFEQLNMLREGLYQVLKALDADQSMDDVEEEDKALLSLVVNKLKASQCILFGLQEDKQKLVIENSLLLTLVRELQLDVANIVTAKAAVDQQFNTKCEQFLLLQAAGQKLAETNEELKIKLKEKEQEESAVKNELRSMEEQLLDLQGAHLNLRDEKIKVLAEQRYLMKLISDLRLEKHNLEEEYMSILAETIFQGTLSSIFQGFVSESSMTIKKLSHNLDKVLRENGDLKETAKVMEGKEAESTKTIEEFRCELEGLEVIRTDQATQIMKLSGECVQLRKQADSADEAIQKLEFELQRLQGESVEMKRTADMLNNEVQRLQGESVEMKRTADMLNNEVQRLQGESVEVKRTADMLNNEVQRLQEESIEMKRTAEMLNNEVQRLQGVTVEMKRTAEMLNNEVQGKAKELDILESEAEALLGQLQISLFKEALLKGKIYDLADLCSHFEDKNHSSDIEIDQLKERVDIADAENREIKSRVSTYAAAFVALKDSIGELENHTAPKRALSEVYGYETKDTLVFEVESHQQTAEEKISKLPFAASNSWELQTRIKAIEKAVVEKERLLMLENSSLSSKLQAALRQIEEEISPKETLQAVGTYEPANAYPNGKELGSGRPKCTREIYEEGSEVITKDVLLDQVSKSSSHTISRRETPKLPAVLTKKEHSGERLSMDSLGEKEISIDRLDISKHFSGSHQDGNERKILERLDSDSEKLTSLDVVIQDLKKKVEVAEKNTKGIGIEYDSVKEQLEESEQAIQRISEMNQKLKKTIEEDPLAFDEKSELTIDQAGLMKRRRISEQARRGSEKVERLQLEVQKLQYLLAKLDDETKNKGKAKAAEKKTSVLLRDFLHGGTRTGPRSKKWHFCSCVRPATTGD